MTNVKLIAYTRMLLLLGLLKWNRDST